MIKARFIFSVLLVLSLFLPLSKCEYYPATEDGKVAEKVVTERYAWNMDEGPLTILWVLPFLIPLV